MKVLYMSYDGMTDALGRSQVIPYLEILSRLGHEIHILSFEKRGISEKEILEVRSILDSVNIKWYPLSFLTRPPLLSKFLDVVKLHRVVSKLQAQERFDIVHCRSYIAALAGLDLKRNYNVKFIFDMRGFWANERIDGNMWNAKNPFYGIIYKYFKKKEKQFFNQADAVVSLTKNSKLLIRELFGETVFHKTTVIPCCTDTNLFNRQSVDSEQITELQNELGIKSEDLVLSYLGSVGTWYLTEEMLLFFKKLKSRKENARFLFITVDKPSTIRRIALNIGLSESDIIIARARRHQVPLYLALSHLSVFFIKPVFSKIASSPTKQAEIMSMGIPMICNGGVGDTDLIFSDGEAGYKIEDFTDKEYEKAVSNIDILLQKDPAQIRSKAIKLFNLEDGARSYHKIYTQI